MPPDARQDLPTPGALDDALPERPAGSYFHQPRQHQQPVAVMALAKADPGTAEGETLADEELVQAPVAVMAGTEGVAPDASAPAPAPAPRSRRTASPPRKSSGRKAAAAGSSAQVDAGAPAAPSPKAVAPAAAPAKAAATSARKPRGPGKPPQSAGE